MAIDKTEWLLIEYVVERTELRYRLKRRAIYRTYYDMSWHIMTFHDKSWRIMTHHDISYIWHFCHTNKKIIFVGKTRNYGIFVAKIYDYALINSFWGSAGFLDSAAIYAALPCTKKGQKVEFLDLKYLLFRRMFLSRIGKWKIILPKNP